MKKLFIVTPIVLFFLVTLWAWDSHTQRGFNEEIEITVKNAQLDKAVQEVKNGLSEVREKIEDLDSNIGAVNNRITKIKNGGEDYIHVPADVTPTDDITKGSFSLVPVPKILLRGEEVPLQGELRCLAVNIYLEMRDKDVTAQRAVGVVTLNRIGKYGNSDVCGAVTNAKKVGDKLVKHQCHFSWYCDGKEIIEIAENPIEEESYRKAVRIASNLLANRESLTDTFDVKATHYHRRDVNPFWARAEGFQYLASKGDHLFYNGH